MLNFPIKRNFSYAASIFGLLFVWQAASMVYHNYELFPSPVSVFLQLIQLFSYQNYITDVIASLKRVVAGFFLAGIMGVSLGIITGINRRLSYIVKPIIELLRPIPPIAWIPIAILLFGLGDLPAIFLVFLGAFFPIFSNTYLGVTHVDGRYIKAAYSLGATMKEIVLHVLIPSSLPSIFIGLKVGLGVGWMAVIAAEMVGAQSGLGYSIQMNRLLLDINKVVSGMVTIGVIGALLNLLLDGAGRKLIPWNRT
ncbi:MAG: ABC-type nitrate/sulfonate/bicarbonate transport system, permease component [Candidatus Nomurabacteria bacterium GW2011_GWB1_43_7]|uniref:ABC-type nitrate/sulfonate/bicarbonate transport system, permease component n=1 Tax=Candidatus Nomurabacteria bacterium GW2011_GWB1_43_7 TaxID=1618747 RepID=A0A0G1I5S4_9BACT|nr:MAG: ABC-type nitrate/sulfonate/bicarbonate transport system, permease component [Candidatus Nomurabacteria bacterium GW2011_GWB1_43_7]